MKSSEFNFKKLLWVLSIASGLGMFYLCVSSGFGIPISLFFAVGSAFPLAGLIALFLVLVAGFWEGILKPIVAWFFK